MKNNYGIFFGMIITSTVVMFGLMYLNSWEAGHVWFSQTRMWMALYMGAIMAIIMLVFMLDPRVRKLADDIIKAQKLEIKEMEALIGDLKGGPAATPEIDGQ